MFLQITASVTFLPLLNDRCSFDLLVYTDVQSAVPMEWSAHCPLLPACTAVDLQKRFIALFVQRVLCVLC